MLLVGDDANDQNLHQKGAPFYITFIVQVHSESDPNLHSPPFVDRIAVFHVRYTQELSLRGSRKDRSMIICDFCGEPKDCLQKEIEGREYDICFKCWNPFAQKLRGKGRAKNRDTVILPAPRVLTERETEEEKPLPGEPPKIWGAVGQPN